MRTLTVCNFATIDGRYEGDDHDIGSLFEHQHPDYSGADSYDHYNTGLLRESDTLVLAGRRSFLGNLEYWRSVQTDAGATAIRREFADLIHGVEKIVVSDTITEVDIEPWPNARIVRIADSRAEVTALKPAPGSGIRPT